MWQRLGNPSLSLADHSSCERVDVFKAMLRGLMVVLVLPQ
jgi:hypothetical protein